jgi:NNMT/PNMT/TEMT family
MPQLIHGASTDAVTFISMADVAQDGLNNADAPWNTFSSHDYWRRNYSALQAEDQEIIHRVSQFFIDAFADRPLARRGIDVGSGTNLYPALLMLPWTEQILLTDHSASNIRWLRDQLADDSPIWTWQPFWQEICETKGYSWIAHPRKLLREVCVGEPGYAGLEQLSVFDLPEARWDLGTMFFVAESITSAPHEFHTAVARFVGALTPGAPFAAAFMAGSNGYKVGDTVFPAVPITVDDVRRHFTELGAEKLSLEMPETEHRVRHGYEGMIVATGFARSA